MTTILGISGALRKGSYNAALLRAAAQLTPAGTQVELGSIADIPLYDGDLEAESGLPAAVSTLKERIVAADGLLLVSPEYNQSIPGVLKNAIDWLSRPGKDIARVFGDKPVALLGASTGPGGTRMGQTAWLPVFRVLTMRPWYGKQLYVTNAADAFDAEGKLVDEKIKKLLGDFMAGYAKFVAEAKAGRG